MPGYKYFFRAVGVVNDPYIKTWEVEMRRVLTQPGKASKVLWGLTEAVFPTWGMDCALWRKMFTWSCKESINSRQETLLRSKAEMLLCPLHPHSPSLQFYRCGCKNIHQSLHRWNATQGLVSAHGGCAAANLLTPVTSNEIWWSQWNLFCFPWLADQCFQQIWQLQPSSITAFTMQWLLLCHTFYYRDLWNLLYLKLVELNQESSK